MTAEHEVRALRPLQEMCLKPAATGRTAAFMLLQYKADMARALMTAGNKTLLDEMS